MSLDSPPETEPDGRTTYLLVDGENIDGTLWNSILHRKPEPSDRPRWDRLRRYAEELWGQPVRALFYINATRGTPGGFVQALKSMGFEPVLLQGNPGQKVVDLAIQKTLESLVSRDDDAILAAHDSDYAPQIENLLTAPRRVAVIGFLEFISTELTQLRDQGLETLDLEDDAGCFESDLPRDRPQPVDDWNPSDIL